MDGAADVGEDGGLDGAEDVMEVGGGGVDVLVEVEEVPRYGITGTGGGGLQERVLGEGKGGDWWALGFCGMGALSKHVLLPPFFLSP